MPYPGRRRMVAGDDRAPCGSGFALVVSLLLMVLLNVLVVGLLSLGAVTMRGASLEEARAVARANARLALMLAINELQKEVGPDQRITAAAAVMAGDGGGRDPGSAAFDARSTDTGFAQSRWLGSWNAWTDWLNDTGIDRTYQRGRLRAFRRWMVSHPDPDLLLDPTYARRGVGSLPTALLVGSGTLGPDGDPSGRVSAPLVTLAGTTGGGYSWWVSGNNQRALVRHGSGTANRQETTGGVANRLAEQPTIGLDQLRGLEAISNEPAHFAKCVTLPTVGVINPAAGLRDAMRSRYHDLTALSIGLPVNVRDGALKQDLNLLLEMQSLPTEYGTYHRGNPGGVIAPIREHRNFGLAPQFSQNINFTPWYKLQQYYQLAHGSAATGNDEIAADCLPVAFRKGLWWTGSTVPNINFNWEVQNLDYYGWGRTPIVSRLMIIFSLKRDRSPVDPAKFAYKMSYNPVMVLWNPYNVTLHSPPLWLAFTPGSLQFKSYRNKAPDGDWRTLARDVRSEGSLGGGSLFDVSVQQSATAASQIIQLKPGETRIFSAQNPAANTRQRVVLTPGYKAPTDGGGFDITLPGLDEVPAGTTIELAMRLGDSRTDHGGQYQMYWTIRNAATGESQRFNELAANPVKDGSPISIIPDTEGRRLSFGTQSTRLPFASFEFVLKSGQDLRNAGRGYDDFDSRGKNFIHSRPWNNRAMYGEATPRMKGMAQYDVHVEVGSGNQLNPDFESSTNRSYLGSAISLGGSTYPGQTLAPMTEVPIVPPTSLAGFAHFRLNPGDSRNFATGRHLWEISTNDSLGIGSSFANPLIPANSIYADVPDAACRGTAIQMKLIRDHHDHVFLNNDAIWDRWFCSGVVNQTAPGFAPARNPRRMMQDFLAGDAPLSDTRYAVDQDRVRAAGDVAAQLFPRNNVGQDAHKRIAEMLVVEGAFNVNSTSVDAWKAMLGGLRDERVSYIDPGSGAIRSAPVPDGRVLLSRFSLPGDATEGVDAGDPAAWGGVRLLTPAQIDRLAAECVRQVKLRGPFLNLSDFVNRRLTNDETGRCGALQAAIDWDEFNGNSPQPGAVDSINGRYKNPDDMITTAKIVSWGLNHPAAGTGSRWTGIPGYLTQSDLLRRLGNGLTVRDDTFTIRAYGEARDVYDRITARAWCEAVVIRRKPFVDRRDDVATVPANLSSINQRFGRRLEMASFRWLQANEI